MSDEQAMNEVEPEVLVDEFTGEPTGDDHEDAIELHTDLTVPIVKAAVFGPKGIPLDAGEDGKSGQKGESPLTHELRADVIAPPYPPGVWVSLLEKSTRLFQSITVMAQNTVGLGWDVVPSIKVDESTTEETKEEILRQTEELEKVLRFPNSKQSFTEIMVLVKMDEEATGNGYLEVTRDDIGRINGMFWAASKSIRRVKFDRDIFVQVRRSGKKVSYFKRFGDEREINRKTGKVFDAEKDNTPEGEPKRFATEIIHFKTPTLSNELYGIPRHAAATPAILGNHLVDKRNVALFENEAIPKFAIIIEGGTLHKDSAQALEDFWNAKTKGTSNYGRTIVLQAELRKTAIHKDNNVRIKLEPLTVGKQEDSNYQGYKKDNNNEIREAFGISEVFFNAELANKTSADVGRQITNEQVFEPEAKRKEHQLTSTLVRDIIGREFAVPLDEASTTGKQILQEKEKTWNGKISIKKFVERSTNPIDHFIEKVEAMGAVLVEKRSIEKQDSNAEGQEFVFKSEPLIRLRFNRATTQDLVNQSKADDIYAKHGALTPNDLRVRIGLSPYPDTEEFAWAKVPLAVAVVQANRGITPGSQGGDDEDGDDTSTPEGDDTEGGEPGKPATKGLAELASAEVVEDYLRNNETMDLVGSLVGLAQGLRANGYGKNLGS